MAWGVVVPTNRPERFASFLEAWERFFDQHDVHLYVCADMDVVDAQIHKAVQGRKAELHHWETIPQWIPRKTDMIRSWGIYRAWKRGCKFTLSLDDDVLPQYDLFEEYERVFDKGAPSSPYLDVGALTSYDGQMRGFPFKDGTGEVALQYGGWDGVLDYDAPTQLAGVNGNETFNPVVLPVPRGAAVTGCAMNMAFRTEISHLMWQLPLYEGRYNRFGDIWSGLFAKKCLDDLGKVVVINGRASVRHERASDPLANLERESPGIPPNEDMWEWLALRSPSSSCQAYRSVTNRAWRYFNERDPEYAKRFLGARDEWLALYE